MTVTLYKPWNLGRQYLEIKHLLHKDKVPYPELYK
jgi:hypothetical protein